MMVDGADQTKADKKKLNDRNQGMLKQITKTILNKAGKGYGGNNIQDIGGAEVEMVRTPEETALLIEQLIDLQQAQENVM